MMITSVTSRRDPPAKNKICPVIHKNGIKSCFCKLSSFFDDAITSQRASKNLNVKPINSIIAILPFGATCFTCGCKCGEKLTICEMSDFFRYRYLIAIINFPVLKFGVPDLCLAVVYLIPFEVTVKMKMFFLNQ